MLEPIENVHGGVKFTKVRNICKKQKDWRYKRIFIIKFQ